MNSILFNPLNHCGMKICLPQFWWSLLKELAAVTWDVRSFHDCYHFVKPCQPLCFEKFSIILIKPVKRVSLAAAARALSDQFVTIMSTLIWLKKIELCLTLMMGGWMSRFGIPIHDSWSRSCSTRACLYIYEHSRALCACALLILSAHCVGGL